MLYEFALVADTESLYGILKENGPRVLSTQDGAAASVDAVRTPLYALQFPNVSVARLVAATLKS
jgi:hypothetical protein